MAIRQPDLRKRQSDLRKRQLERKDRPDLRKRPRERQDRPVSHRGPSGLYGRKTAAAEAAQAAPAAEAALAAPAANKAAKAAPAAKAAQAAPAAKAAQAAPAAKAAQVARRPATKAAQAAPADRAGCAEAAHEAGLQAGLALKLVAAAADRAETRAAAAELQAGSAELRAAAAEKEAAAAAEGLRQLQAQLEHLKYKEVVRMRELHLKRRKLRQVVLRLRQRASFPRAPPWIRILTPRPWAVIRQISRPEQRLRPHEAARRGKREAAACTSSLSVRACG